MNEILVILKDLHEEYDYENSNDFIEDGYLDSFDMISLVSALDEKFGISIDGLDILPENFCNINAITDTVRKNGGNI